MTVGFVILLVIVAGVALRLSVPRLSGNSAATGITLKDGQSLLGDCPDTPNCQGSESSRSNQHVERFVLTTPASTAMTTLAQIVTSLPGTSIEEQNQRYIHATFSTRLMGFTDDVEFLLSDDEQSVQVRSASRLGKSDLGANLKRINQLREMASGRI